MTFQPDSNGRAGGKRAKPPGSHYGYETQPNSEIFREAPADDERGEEGDEGPSCVAEDGVEGDDFVTEDLAEHDVEDCAEQFADDVPDEELVERVARDAAGEVDPGAERG